MSAIIFKSKLSKIGPWTIVRLPKDASAQLPSRGQAMVEGTINNIRFQTPLEPDGQWSHWFRVSPKLLKAMNTAVGDSVTLTIRPMKQWPNPEVPANLRRALQANPQAHTLWDKITPMARWEWIRWIHSTGYEETRQKRIRVACSKLANGERRPCCWNRNLCTEPSVSKNGVLLSSAAK